MMTQDQRQELIDLSWRYAVLIGITDYEGVVSREVAESDRHRWANLIKQSPSGRPAFIDEDAIGFMQEQSGLSYDDCQKVLLDEWKRAEG